MHQFITQPKVTPHELIVDDEQIVHQISNVLRMEQGDKIIIQECNENETVRWQCTIKAVQNNSVTCVTDNIQKNVKNMLNYFTVPLPNKADKLELIVQKLAEIGIDKIDIRPARRSIMRELSANKMRRLKTIAREAVEQSHGWFLPEITFYRSFPDEPTDKLVVFEQFDELSEEVASKVVRQPDETVRGVIGPEGGFVDDELVQFRTAGAQFVSLGDTVLRTETAAIVGGWIIKTQDVVGKK